MLENETVTNLFQNLATIILFFIVAFTPAIVFLKVCLIYKKLNHIYSLQEHKGTITID